jgi:hypothetical protein
MRKLLFAAMLAVMGAFVFAAGSPAQAVPSTIVGEVSKAAPQSEITQAHCCRHRYYRRYYYYRPRYYYRRYHYRHYHYRRCHYFWRYGYRYRRCYYYW